MSMRGVRGASLLAGLAPLAGGGALVTVRARDPTVGGILDRVARRTGAPTPGRSGRRHTAVGGGLDGRVRDAAAEALETIPDRRR